MHSAGRRLKAARALGGYTTPRALSDALHLPNFGDRTIREVEADRRVLHPHEAQAVADLVDLAPAFFTIDLRTIGDAPRRDVTISAPPLTVPNDPDDDTLSSIRATLEQLLDRVDQAAAQAASETTRGPADTGRREERREGSGG